VQPYAPAMINYALTFLAARGHTPLVGLYKLNAVDP
jgi:hypothetical protein